MGKHKHLYAGLYEGCVTCGEKQAKDPKQRVDELREIIVKHTSEMLDSPDEHGIYPTTKFYNNLEKAINSIIAQEVEAAQKEERSLALIYLHDTNRKGDYLRKLSLLTNNTKGKK